MQLKVPPCVKDQWVLQICNLDGIYMNIYEEPTHYFRVQSERELTLILHKQHLV